MQTLSPKQQEIRDRENRILDTARHMLLTGGYHGLSMDRIAGELDYAKGTIYNHFGCKEEIIIALAIQTSEHRTKMFERAALFRGSSRERIQCIGVAAELFVRLYPEHFNTEQIIRSSSVWEKTTEERRAICRSCEQRCVGIVSGIVRDGLASGDLMLPVGTTPEDVVFGMWSLSFGAYSIITTSESLRELGIGEPFEVVRNSMARLLDGYGWAPLSVDVDREELMGRISQEVFPDEFADAFGR